MLYLLIIPATIRLCKVEIHFGLTRNRLAEGFKHTWSAAGVYVLGFIIANTISSLPLGNTPTLGRVLVEGLITVFFAAFLEEVLLRGVLITIFMQVFGQSKHVNLLSVLVASSFFAIGHVPSVIDQGLLMCLFRFAYPFCIGVLFGAMYRKYDHLWLPVICHAVLNCISITIMLFAASPVVTMKHAVIGFIAVLSLVGGVYGTISAMRQDSQTNTAIA